jgi:cyd operon protein YbgT
MWYFSWILGTGLACTFAVLNALWLELRVGDVNTPTTHPGQPTA